MPSGAEYGPWCQRQRLRREQAAVYGKDFQINLSRQVLAQKVLDYLFNLSDKKREDSKGAWYAEMDHEGFLAWLQYHPELQKLLGCHGQG
jgi:hypothetical protein